MNPDKDYYAILGVSRNAKSAELKSAFRRLATTCHPDHHPGDRQAEDRFKELSEAYGILSSPEKRTRYDRTRRQGSSPQTIWSAKPGVSKETFSSTRPQAWKKPSLKKNRSSPPNQVKSKPGPPAPDYAERVFAALKKVPLKKAGETAKYSWRKWLTKAKDKLSDLAENWGLWQETESSWDLRYNLFISPEAARDGAEIRFRHQVNGEAREILLKVPPGIKDGTRLRLAGQGESGPSGLKGDLILDISVKPR